MRTTIDLPSPLVERTKVSAARKKTSMRELVIKGLEKILDEEDAEEVSPSALERLRQGYALGNQPLSREDLHAR